MSPKISIIVPTYNRARRIGATLETVLHQTYADWEAVVVDDRSTDATADVVRAVRDDRVRLLLHSVNRGPAAARNTAIRAARAEWIAFLDSDDLWEPRMLQELLALATGSPLRPGVVYGACMRLWTSTRRREPMAATLRGRIHSDLLWGPRIQTSTLVVRRSLLLQIGLMDERIVPTYEEWDLELRLARQTCFDFVPEVLATYVCHPEGTLSSNAVRSALGYQDVIRKHAAEIDAALGPRGWAHHAEMMARLWAAARRPDRVATWMAHALKWSPSLRRAAHGASYLLQAVRGNGVRRGEWI
jgi:glycosyltransferase involved in cell wall biosynthesis